MEKIGQGYFYDVFDLGNGRVLKKGRPFFDLARSAKGSAFSEKAAGWIRTWRFIRECKKVTKDLGGKLAVLPPELIGNPVFLAGADYEQDKVLLLMDYFDSHDLEENKKIVDSYMELIAELLKYGIHDYVYKFKNSYGVNERGKVVFVDFNEVTFSKEKTLRLADEKRWQSEAQYRKFPEGELKRYLAFRFGETLTSSAVNALWGLNGGNKEGNK